ncbi:MAG: polysaccharide biosynthesis/export family protein [Candidatus Omnitrophica bacterium]|nr:polysaccharide biosynthesis/export family protein [Candidatus Omnitrophota bacterium]
MTTSKFLILQIVALWSLLIFIPKVEAQDALNQLNNQNSTQDEAVNKSSVTTQAIDQDKIRATMSSGEFKSFAGAQAYIEQNSKYTLGPDDVIDIVVMRHPEVSGQYIINKEGKIQYEFVGDIVLAGLTKEQAVKFLTKELSTYIIRPEISFKISGYNSKIVYVVGEVARPGRIPMHGDTITVRDALLEAGLPIIPTAATDSASIFTPAATGKVIRKKVNVEALLYKGDLRENYVLHPGDCLYVPATFLAKAMRYISPVTQPVGEVAGAGGSAKYAF